MQQTPGGRLQGALYCAGATLLCLAWTWYAGRDVSRDVLDYHLYAAYHFIDGRLGQDFLGGGAQTYLNPLAGLPFYWMVRAGWHSLVIGGLLALLHSVSLWALHAIGEQLLPADMPARRVALGASLLLAMLTPAFLFELGTSFVDVIAAVPVLVAVLWLAKPADGASRRDVLAGICLGIATGLKLTHAIYPIAACALICVPWRGLRQVVSRSLALALGCVVGFLLIDGAWALALSRRFGNPLFPMFNDWFKSSDFPASGAIASRFHAGGVIDILGMPLQLLLPTRLFSEIPAPDARLVLLVLVLLALLLKRWRGGKPDTDAGDAVFPGLLAFFLLSLGLWLGTSSNGRYAMPTWMLLGPLLVAGFARLRPAPRLLVYGLGLAVCVQAGQLVLLPQKRFAAAAWTSTWFDVRVPPSLQREPWLFLSLDIQTGAFLFPFLDRGSAFVNLVGQNSLALDRPGGRPLARILGEHDGRVRSLLPIVFRSDTTPAATLEDSVTRQDALLRRLALAVDRADCQTLGLDNGAPSPQPPVFISCRLVAAAPTPPDVTERLLRVDRAFDAIEQQCPALFGTRSPVTDDFGKASYRRYGRDDMLLMESREKVWLLWGWRQDGAEALGSTDDVGEGQVRLDCASRRVIRASTS